MSDASVKVRCWWPGHERLLLCWIIFYVVTIECKGKREKIYVTWVPNQRLSMRKVCKYCKYEYSTMIVM